MTLHSFILFCF